MNDKQKSRSNLTHSMQGAISRGSGEKQRLFLVARRRSSSTRATRFVYMQRERVHAWAAHHRSEIDIRHIRWFTRLRLDLWTSTSEQNLFRAVSEKDLPCTLREFRFLRASISAWRPQAFAGARKKNAWAKIVLKVCQLPVSVWYTRDEGRVARLQSINVSVLSCLGGLEKAENIFHRANTKRCSVNILRILDFDIRSKSFQIAIRGWIEFFSKDDEKSYSCMNPHCYTRALETQNPRDAPCKCRTAARRSVGIK